MATNAVQIPNQTPGTTVIVVNQRGRNPGPQYMRRGTTCCNGYHVSTCSFAWLIIFGIIITTSSLSLLTLSKLAFIGTFFGLFLFGLFIYLMRKAVREFDALPPDHPDRLTYSGFDITELPVNLNPLSNQAAAPPNPEPQVPPIPGQNYVFPESSFPQSPNYPGQGPSAPPPESYRHPQGYTPAHGPSAPPQGPHPPPSGYYPHPAKNDDDPPPYSAL